MRLYKVASFCEFAMFCAFLGVRNRVVSKRVVLADVPLYRNVLPRVFPGSATLAEESYYNYLIFLDPTNRNEGISAKTALLSPLGVFCPARMACTRARM